MIKVEVEIKIYIFLLCLSFSSSSLAKGPSFWDRYFSLLGSDKNNNNIRDDIENWIIDTIDDVNMMNVYLQDAKYRYLLLKSTSMNEEVKAFQKVRQNLSCKQFFLAAGVSNITREEKLEYEGMFTNNITRYLNDKFSKPNIPSHIHKFPSVDIVALNIDKFCEFKIKDKEFLKKKVLRNASN